jgi:hypothetical protein
MYHSKAEAEFARRLDMLKHAQDPHERVDSWERQIRFLLLVNDVRICDYVVDFLVRYADGRKVLVEVKGPKTKEWIIKDNLFRATFLRDHPDIGYEVVQ